MHGDFAGEARRAFAFLDPAFAVVAQTQSDVRFESATGVFVRVFHASDDGYLGFRVGLLEEPRDALTDTDFLTLSGAGDLAGLFVHHEDDVGVALTELARRLRVYGASALAGDRSIFEQARALRRAYTERYMRPKDDGQRP